MVFFFFGPYGKMKNNRVFILINHFTAFLDRRHSWGAASVLSVIFTAKLTMKSDPSRNNYIFLRNYPFIIGKTTLFDNPIYLRVHIIPPVALRFSTNFSASSPQTRA
jgi:hypothetical protein